MFETLTDWGGLSKKLNIKMSRKCLNGMSKILDIKSSAAGSEDFIACR